MFGGRAGSIDDMRARKKVRVLLVKSGAELAALCRQQGLTQEQLAAHLGCTYETASNYERQVIKINLSIGTYLRYFFTYGLLNENAPKARPAHPTQRLRTGYQLRPIPRARALFESFTEL